MLPLDERGSPSCHVRRCITPSGYIWADKWADSSYKEEHFVAEQTNSARRLHDLLSAVHQRSQAVPLRQVWAELFSLRHDDTVEIWRHLILLDGLFTQVREELRAVESDPEPFTRHFGGVSHSLRYLTLDHSVNELQKAITPQFLEGLHLAAYVIDKGRSERLLTENDLGELSKQLHDLFEEVEAAEFDARLRELSLRIIETLQNAINTYRISGIKAFEQALEEAIGSLLFHLRRRPVDPPPKDQVRKVWATLAKVEAIMARALPYANLALETLPKLLNP